MTFFTMGILGFILIAIESFKMFLKIILRLVFQNTHSGHNTWEKVRLEANAYADD